MQKQPVLSRSTPLFQGAGLFLGHFFMSIAGCGVPGGLPPQPASRRTLCQRGTVEGPSAMKMAQVLSTKAGQVGGVPGGATCFCALFAAPRWPPELRKMSRNAGSMQGRAGQGWGRRGGAAGRGVGWPRQNALGAAAGLPGCRSRPAQPPLLARALQEDSRAGLRGKKRGQAGCAGPGLAQHPALYTAQGPGTASKISTPALAARAWRKRATGLYLCLRVYAQKISGGCLHICRVGLVTYVMKVKYKSSSSQVQVHTYKFTSTSSQVQAHKYKYNTSTS